jgi:hypothetical protein
VTRAAGERTTYVYAIARPFHPVHLWGVRGVDDAAVHLVHDAELVAVVSTLSISPAKWAAIAPAHHAVVGAVARHTAALPLPPATLFPSERRVVEMLRSERGRFRRAIARLDRRVGVLDAPLM